MMQASPELSSLFMLESIKVIIITNVHPLLEMELYLHYWLSQSISCIYWSFQR